jgi:hypothetical protein
MYIETVPNRTSPPAILLRKSYRDGGKVKKRTLANLTDWPTELVEGFRALLKGGKVVSADSEDELIEAAIQHAKTVHQAENTPAFRKELRKMVKEGTPPP